MIKVIRKMKFYPREEDVKMRISTVKEMMLVLGNEKNELIKKLEGLQIELTSLKSLEAMTQWQKEKQ